MGWARVQRCYKRFVPSKQVHAPGRHVSQLSRSYPAWDMTSRVHTSSTYPPFYGDAYARSTVKYEIFMAEDPMLACRNFKFVPSIKLWRFQLRWPFLKHYFLNNNVLARYCFGRRQRSTLLDSLPCSYIIGSF